MIPESHLRIFVTKEFEKFVRKEKISDVTLLKAVDRVVSGLIDADLGGNVIKQRIARKGEGKSGGYRTIIILREDYRAFFVYGFAKKDQGNIAANELKASESWLAPSLGSPRNSSPWL